VGGDGSVLASALQARGDCLLKAASGFAQIAKNLLQKGTFFFIVLLSICAYKAWVLSPPCPHPLPYHPLRPLPLPSTPLIPSRNYFSLISNFVEERV
jgi:hypothetical protein